MDIVDLLKLRKYITTNTKVETIESIAGDINIDSNLNIVDILKLRKMIGN